ncbi:methionyl-tRNA formyltransferase [Eubacterium sp. 14-2]|uniref:methionyl-tRNA formyltransferase n=1 Tax=Eubacterium sp. 14-2 TaxID=1235790 RepID=UPI000334EF33|nr:methionyl-tRNA formyltransferase [Eubacterium sp. 14-2]EOT24293.1 methionyl-tRNA formyltransferase [Eubacterium sp. 14-2]
MKVIFMGTPDFSVGTLEHLIQAGHEIVLVVTQPDKPKGRGKAMQFPPVKEAALAHGLEVYQPAKIREPECVEYLREKNADIMVVVAFGQILPAEILEMPRYGCVNVHASLLPKYRGAAPIQWAVINGEKVTGVTTMRMDQGVDTGDMILKEEVVLREDETGGSLFDRLAETGAKLCVRTLEAIEQGTAEYIPQNHEEATHTSMITRQFGNIDWTKPACELERLVRGLSPWPGTYTQLDGKTLKIWRSALAEPEETFEAAEPGTVTAVTGNAIHVKTGQGILALKEVQLEGKKRMTADAFLRGFPLEPGKSLGGQQKEGSGLSL